VQQHYVGEVGKSVTFVLHIPFAKYCRNRSVVVIITLIVNEDIMFLLTAVFVIMIVNGRNTY